MVALKPAQGGIPNFTPKPSFQGVDWWIFAGKYSQNIFIEVKSRVEFLTFRMASGAWTRQIVVIKSLSLIRDKPKEHKLTLVLEYHPAEVLRHP